jgi:tetratricopeptide (TPR) repeat protein
VERVEALERYPSRATMPSSLALKLALALVEAGRFDDAERVFAGRFFAREEFGTNVRQVWLEVRLQRALSLAAHGEKEAALGMLAHLAEPVPDLAFTNDGMEVFLEGARTQYLIGEAYARCGDTDAARTHWEKAAAGADAYPYPHAAYAYRAARRLRPEAAETERPRVQAALDAWIKRLEVGTNFPGANAVGQGLFLRELGREEEARAKLKDALYLPDRLMSHYQSRAALREDATERAAR